MPLVLRTSQAHLDLIEAALHIAEENLTAADRWLDIIDEKCQSLARMPELGRKRPDLAPELRRLSGFEFNHETHELTRINP